MPKVSPKGAGYAQTILNSMVLEDFHVLEILCFFWFLGLFWALFLLILGVLGRHLGSQKVDANFDRKTGMELNPGISGNPKKSRDGGSKSPKNYQQDLPWTARPPEALHIVAEARCRIYIYIYIYIRRELKRCWGGLRSPQTPLKVLRGQAP